MIYIKLLIGVKSMQFIYIYIYIYINLSRYTLGMGVACCERPHPRPPFLMLGQTHVNGWSRVFVSQNGGSTSYIFPLRLGVLQWSRHLFNYWKNKKTIIEKFLILLIWNWIYIDHRKLHGFGPRYNLR